MTANTISLKGQSINTSSVFFFGKSEKNGKRTLFKDGGHCYNSNFRNGKYIIVDSELSSTLPDYCYLKINEAVERETAFVVTDVELIMPKPTTKAEIEGLYLVTRPDSAFKETVKYYNAKSILGDIDCLIVTYKMKGHKETFFDSYLNFNGRIFEIEEPMNKYFSPMAEDYSTVYFHDFELLK